MFFLTTGHWFHYQPVVNVFAKQALSNARPECSKNRSQAQGRGAGLIAVSA